MDPTPESASPHAHIPVMSRQVLELLDPRPGEVILDCTLGRGGHCEQILPRLAPGGRYVGLDMDPDARMAVRHIVDKSPVTIDLRKSNFVDAAEALADLGLRRVDGLLADLGVCSDQLDDPLRGLSFRHDGPLDMRLDPQGPVTAADLLARLGERDLADLIFKYGEERRSRKIARLIVEARRRSPIKTTRQLAELCARAAGPTRGPRRIDPATRTFQALRIAVNEELASLEALLEQLPTLLNPGGRAVIISFHSLEDRLVKQAFREFKRSGWARWITKKPLTPDRDEIDANRRSRSAKLRALHVGDDAGGEERNPPAS